MNLPLTINGVQFGLKKKEFSAVDLVDTYLARIQKFDKDINSYITVTSDIAYKQAKQADRLIKDKGDKAFKEFPLIGVCVSHKDMFLTKGVRTTAGSNVLKDYIPVYSATCVKRIEKAGAIMLGKLNCDAWAHGSSGENSDFGLTKNPYGDEFVPGGSSSGSGAALAANMAMITTGTDTCGSIRLPANYCGVYGFKPTYGVVSRYGVVAMVSSLDSVGHLGRSVDDIKTVFGITRGNDKKDSTLKDGSYPKTPEKIKIGIAKEFFERGVSRQVKDNVEKAIKVFEKSKIEFVDVSIPHMKYAISTYYIIQPAEVSSNLGRYDGVRYGKERSNFGDEAKRRIILGSYVLSSGYYDAYYLKAMKVRSILVEETTKVFGEVDALIAPVASTPPFKIGEKVDDPLKMYLTDIYAAIANLTGIPGLAVPYGLSSEGLPLGFQLLGPRFGEETLFSLAKTFENSTDYKPLMAPLE